MRNVIRHLEPGTLATIILTLVLFIVALFLKGLTHDMLLEAAVFLVSVKLMLLSYHTSVSTDSIQNKLDQIQHALHALNPERNAAPKATAPEPHAAETSDS